MENFMNWIAQNTFLSIGVGAFVCGVALFYLVMQRTRKHRADELGAE